MRRIAFALVLMIASGWAAPSRAQWWGGGWGRPCFDGCRPWMGGGGGWAGPRRFVVLGYPPGRSWGGPEAFGPPRFREGGWGWGRRMWRREMRWRRFEAWRRWADAGRQAAAAEAERPQPRLHRWTRWRIPMPAPAVARPEPARAAAAGNERRGPNRTEAAVAMFPTGSLRLSRPRLQAAVPSRVLAAAAMFRRPAMASTRPAPMEPAVVRGPAPPPRPIRAALRAADAAIKPRPDVRRVGLRNQPAIPQPPTARAAPAPTAPAPAAPNAPEPIGGAATADVPVAPLD